VRRGASRLGRHALGPRGGAFTDGPTVAKSRRGSRLKYLCHVAHPLDKTSLAGILCRGRATRRWWGHDGAAAFNGGGQPTVVNGGPKWHLQNCGIDKNVRRAPIEEWWPERGSYERKACGGANVGGGEN
jgi:hypothetical protein